VPVLVILMMLGLVLRIEIAGGGESFRDRGSSSWVRHSRISVPLLRAAPQQPNGINLLLLVILLAVVSDSGAYFVGRFMADQARTQRQPNKQLKARRRLARDHSGRWLLIKMIGGTWDLGTILLFAAMISILAQLGDLAGSALKRAAGVKDSGWISLATAACSIALVHWSSRSFSPTIGSMMRLLGAAFSRSETSVSDRAGKL